MTGDRVDLTALTVDELLVLVIDAPRLEQMRAWWELMRRGDGAWAGAAVIDEACGVAMTVEQLFGHLRRYDSPAAIERRDGRRLHTASNVHFGSRDDAAGPANAFGTGGR
ncbi:MAG TPA: hypothetical protein VG899_12850 [Mycobacteriales bacterium]|nr:hypothetical protein [Mycobacteriales bacterium]